jgi:hypothetical protein
VDVAVEVDDVDAATQAADELAGMAQRWRTDGLRAAAAQAKGGVELAAGEPARAVAPPR